MKNRRFRMATRNFAMLFILVLQFVLAAFCLQALWFFDATWLVYEILSVIVFFVSYIFLFVLLYSFEDPEFKVPWIVLLLSIPGIGVVVYLLFKQKGLSRKQKKLLTDIRSSFQPYFQSKAVTGRAHDSPDYQPITFLENAGEFSGHRNNKVSYYKCGEEFFPDFIKKLEEAKEFIFMEFFIVREGKEWDQIHEVLKRKAQEGVEIRFLYDDFGCFKYLPSTYARMLRKEGIDAYRFNPVGILLNGRYNNRSHRKIAVIDHKYGFTGGMNLGDEYANDITEFGYWKDTMVCVEGSCINNMIALFLENYDMNRKKLSDYGKYLDYTYPEYETKGVISFFGTGPEIITPIRLGEQNFVNIIENATRTLYISTPYLIPSLDLLHSLQRAALRGVDVHLIVPGIPDKKLVYEVAQYYFAPLLESGVKIYKYTPGFNHMKSCLADGNVSFVGTINMDYRSLVHHYECGITIVNHPVNEEIEKDFLEMISKSERVPADFRLGKKQMLDCTVLRLFMPLL